MVKDMTAGSPAKLIVRFALPLMLGNLFQQFYSMVDAVIVGRYLGKNPLAAVGSTSSLTNCAVLSAISFGLRWAFRCCWWL